MASFIVSLLCTCVWSTKVKQKVVALFNIKHVSDSAFCHNSNTNTQISNKPYSCVYPVSWISYYEVSKASYLSLSLSLSQGV